MLLGKGARFQQMRRLGRSVAGGEPTSSRLSLLKTAGAALRRIFPLSYRAQIIHANSSNNKPPLKESRTQSPPPSIMLITQIEIASSPEKVRDVVSFQAIYV